MFLHNKRMMYTVRVDNPNPMFAKMLQEQFGGPNGELAAAMRYFTQGWNEPDGQRRSMLLDIATEGLSHLEMGAQSLHLLLKDSPAELIDQVEGNYLGDLLNGKMPDYVSMSLNSGPNLLGGGGPRLTDSMGAPWTAAYVDTIGQPAADLRSDIAGQPGGGQCRCPIPGLANGVAGNRVLSPGLKAAAAVAQQRSRQL